MIATLATVDEGARQRFEAAWRQGAPPRIEDFLPPADAPTYEATLLELVAIDLEMSWRSGAGRRADEYIARFPALSTPEYVRELSREEDRARRAAQESLRPGSTLGRYRLLDVHARGGFGVVWRASDDSLGREVAVKTLAQPRDVDSRQRFVAEARVASRLEHPSIVPVHELAEGDAPWYSMKLVRGQTLGELMRAFRSGDPARNLAWRRLLEAFLALTRAVGFAHARGFMHRDIKPDNVIVGDFGETVLLDWGLARAIAGPAEPEGTVFGTPGFMSPEQAAGLISEQDARTDVYALGVTLGLIVQLERATPKALRSIARKATALEPAERYADAGALAEELERYLSDEKVAAHRESWSERLARSIRRYRTRWAVGAVAFVLGMLGIAAALLIAHDAELRRRRDVYAEAVRDETRARGSLTAGRPADALAALDEALAELAGEDEVTEIRARIAGMRERARRLDVIATAKEEAWFLSGEERDGAALGAIERALAAAGPKCSEVTADLPAGRADECRRAIHRLLLLEAVLRTKSALSNPLAGAQACEQAYAALIRARAEGSTAYADLVQSLCARFSPSVPRPTALPTPPSSTDAFMFGLTYVWIGALPQGLRGLLEPVFKEGGLDATDPIARAIDRLREAVRLEPGEYWHSFMLGGALTSAGDYRAAGLVLEHCVALRPDYPRGLEARGMAVVLQGLTDHREDLVALGRTDYDRALQLAPMDPWTHWSRAHLMVLLGRPAEGMPEYLTAFALDPDALWHALPGTAPPEGLSTAPEAERARMDAEQLTAVDPNNAAAWTVHAAANLVLGNDAGARASIDRALALTGAPGLATAIRALLRLRAGDPSGALSDLGSTERESNELVVRLRVDAPSGALSGLGTVERLAIAARGLALARVGRTSEAHDIFTRLASPDSTETERAWAQQQLAPH